ncbi:MAG: hypothetical protein H0W74_05290 [Sphingosinicella sp.]|nr:hypothetical protein [Sphingosinicella sp.]
MADYHPSHRSAVDRFFFDWFSGETLGAVRLYFGIGLALYVLTQYPQLLILDQLGTEFHYTLPIWYFWQLGIDHNVPWLILPTLLATFVACLFFAFGKWTKPAIIAILIGIFYLKGVRDSFSGDVHHREVPIIAILTLFFLSKCERVWSLDARRKGFSPIEDWEGSWPIRAMQIYIVMFYFWALVAKLRVSGLFWFEGGGRVQETLVGRALRDGFGADGNVVNLSLGWELAQRPDLIFTFGIFVFLFELLIPLLLFVKDWRIRLVILAGAAFFHFSNFMLMNVQFYFYPFVFVAFFDMAKVHRWLKGKLRLRGVEAPSEITGD